LTLVFLLEELSMKGLLEGVLPRALPPSVGVAYVVHEGKQDLRKSIPRKLRAWGDPEARFVILHDQDRVVCEDLKAELVELCRQAGQPDALVRIVCQNLESWVLGDLDALAAAFGDPRIARHKQRAKYQQPDTQPNGLSMLQELAPGYQKVSGARKVGPHLDLSRIRSHSFQVFLSGLKGMLEAI
jgi:hypothetical protein